MRRTATQPALFSGTMLLMPKRAPCAHRRAVEMQLVVCHCCGNSVRRSHMIQDPCSWMHPVTGAQCRHRHCLDCHYDHCVSAAINVPMVHYSICRCCIADVKNTTTSSAAPEANFETRRVSDGASQPIPGFSGDSVGFS